MKLNNIDDPVHAADLDAILAFIPRFRDLDPATLRQPGIREEGGQLVIDRGENHALVTEFISAFYGHGFVRDFDWIAWQAQAVRFYSQPEILRRADIGDCIKLLTLHSRLEHFWDGHFALMVRTGHVSAILARLRGLISTRSLLDS